MSLRGRLQAHVAMLAGTIGERHVGRPRALDQAAAYLEQELAATGLPVTSQEFTAGGQAVRNLEVELPGQRAEGALVVVGAHYDTVAGSPGADDNASGAAAVVEIARHLARTRPARAVRCALFVNEEPPWFQTGDMGSLRYAQRLFERKQGVDAMLSLESLGYYVEGRGTQQYPFPLGLLHPDTGNFVGLVSDLRCRPLLRKVARSFARQTTFPVVAAALPGWVPGVAWSDQWAFWQHGFPALMVTDTAPFRYPAYHTEGDTPDQLRYDALAEVVAALGGVVLDLCRDDRV
jgi:Zn-dependent M28 family amino/carboxypeptidase